MEFMSGLVLVIHTVNWGILNIPVNVFFLCEITVVYHKWTPIRSWTILSIVFFLIIISLWASKGRFISKFLSISKLDWQRQNTFCLFLGWFLFASTPATILGCTHKYKPGLKAIQWRSCSTILCSPYTLWFTFSQQLHSLFQINTEVHSRRRCRAGWIGPH